MNRAPFSTDYWHAIVTNQDTGMSRSELEHEMLRTLKAEVPQMCSVTMERACNLHCAHCIYPCHASSESISRKARLPELILRAVEQLPGQEPLLLHEGRTLQPWHVEVMSSARKHRPGLKVGLIDNGTYAKHLDKFSQSGLRLDWLDISIDGDEQTHNLQRRSAIAYRDAIRGLEHGREVTKRGGRVTALFTMTSINHVDLKAAAKALFEPTGCEAYVDELHVTTVTPIKKSLIDLEQLDLTTFWQQAQSVYARYGQNDGRQRVFFRLYRHHELAKLARTTSKDEMRDALRDVRFAPGEVHFTLCGVPFIYSPLSTWPGETFLIDADGAYRTAYSIGETLVDLQKGKNKEGEDLTGYTVEGHLKPDFDLARLYRRCVDMWWRFKGKQFLREEATIFRQFNL